MELEKKEYEESVDMAMDEIPWEDIPEEQSSPINEPVKRGESHTVINLSDETEPVESGQSYQQVRSEQEPVEQHDPDAGATAPPESGTIDLSDDEPLDAPEQELNAPEEDQDEAEPESGGVGDNLNIPDSHSGLAADSVMGMASHFLEIGGGFFVKIKKKDDFFEFEEVVQRIDEQNEKNVRRFRLDEEDRALLRPLLIHVLKTRAQKLTPEQQLIGAIITILVKKTQMAMEIRSENQMLVARLEKSIKEAKRYYANHQPEPKPEQAEEVADEDQDEHKHAA